MNKASVFFTDLYLDGEESLLQKLSRLVKRAGIETLDYKNKYTAIKIHFGEPGNLAYLRPNYSKIVADIVKEQGGRVFLTDCNTLYVGRRKNALDHLDSAYENGYNPFATGCHVIIADGLKGTDEALVPVNGECVKEAKIGRAVMDADIIISLTHFKCHEMTGIGGTLKNIGMGCGSRAGKMEMHSSGKPRVHKDACIFCGECARNCAHSAISFIDKKADIDHGRCVGCGRCIGVCPEDAVKPAEDETVDMLNRKIAEYSLAVLKGRPQFHISLVWDVSPYCDCHGKNDIPIVPDVGMLASFDPVALDRACTDLVNAQPVLPDSLLASQKRKRDHFTSMHPITDWRVMLDHAEKMGLGFQDYELIRL